MNVLCSFSKHINLWYQAWISIKQMILMIIAKVCWLLTMTWTFFLSTLFVLFKLNKMVWRIYYHTDSYSTDEKTDARRSLGYYPGHRSSEHWIWDSNWLLVPEHKPFNTIVTLIIMRSIITIALTNATNTVLYVL